MLCVADIYGSLAVEKFHNSVWEFEPHCTAENVGLYFNKKKKALSNLVIQAVINAVSLILSKSHG